MYMYVNRRTKPSNFYLLPVPKTMNFWLDFICCFKKVKIDLERLSDTDILLEIWQWKDDFLLVNHLLIFAKQYINEFWKENASILPSE